MQIAIAEDNNYLAQSISEKLLLRPDKFEICYRAKNGKEIVEYVLNTSEPDVILMDIEMPVMDGITATELIHSAFTEIKIIILTVFDDNDKIFNAIKAGASGYLLKDEPIEKIIEGIDTVVSGGAPMSASIAAKTLQLLRDKEYTSQTAPKRAFNLTNRELEILEFLKQGHDYNKTAEMLCISPLTVRKHIDNIYRKLQVNNKIQAVQKALQHNVIK